MNVQLLDKARARVPSVPVLVNMVSKRVRQLIAGFQPYVVVNPQGEDKLDIALREIAEGKIVAEIDFSAETEDED